MTERRAALRRRRTTGVGNIPSEVLSWFRGEPRKPGAAPIPWRAASFPGYALLPGWWDAFAAENPRAKPPAAAEWLADPSSPHRYVPAWLLAQAQGLRGAAALPPAQRDDPG